MKDNKIRDNTIIELYTTQPDLKVEEIARQLDISVGTIYRVLRINGVPKRGSNMRKTAFSEAQEPIIVQEYIDGASLMALQKKYSTSYDTLKDLLERHNIQQRSAAKRKNPDLVENYFEKIDCPEKAYWLGWMISDGCVSVRADKKEYDIQLTIKAEDEDILHVLERDLGVCDRVYTSNTEYKRFSLSCKKMTEDLAKYGIVNNKTFTVGISELIPKEYLSHLVRGVFDGDGSISISSRCGSRKLEYEFAICGNEQVVTQVEDILEQAIPSLPHNRVTNNNSIKRIRYSGIKDIIALTEYLYQGCTDHYLARKHKRLSQISIG